MEHLEARTRSFLDATVAERVRYIQTIKWIGYPKALEILGQMEDLFNHPPSHRMPNILIASPTNNGKTMIKNRFLEQHPVDDNIEGDTAEVPVFDVQMPGRPDPRRFYMAILKKLFATYRDTDNLARLETQAISIMQACGVKMLIIDDLHNILAGRMDAQRQFLNLLRTLGNDLEAPLVCLGTPKALRAIQIDDQLANRFLPYKLPTWRYGKDFRRLLNTYESLLPLPERSYLATEETAQYILAKTEGTIGEAFMLINYAAIKAVRGDKPKITIPLLENCGYISPKERRRAAEQGF